MNSFQYIDRVYGEVTFSEPVLLELVHSEAMQRLKGIDQAGYFEPHFPGTKHTRFEHSLGVCALLRRYHASLEEQVAGLIHDVSHSAFSHAVDYILDGGSQTEHDLQDNIHDDFVASTDIPEILARYGMSFEQILNDANYPLKETALPDLCADRIDYSLRGALVYKAFEYADVQELLSDLCVIDNKWVFKTKESAKKFAQMFAKLNSSYWCGLPTAKMFLTTGRCMRYALERGYITKGDLYKDDETVIKKITDNCSDKVLARWFLSMNTPECVVEDDKDFEEKVYCKSRVVDPRFVCGSGQKRLSADDEFWARFLPDEASPKAYFLRVVCPS